MGCDVQTRPNLASVEKVPVREVMGGSNSAAVIVAIRGIVWDFFFFSSRRRHTRFDCDWSSDVCSSDLAHELGHARDGDVVTGTVLGALGAASAVILVYLLGHWTALLDLAGVTGVGEPRSIGLLLALATLAGLVAGPAQNALSRRIEARADAHALALTDDPTTFEAMEAPLSTVNLADPDPPRPE